MSKTKLFVFLVFALIIGIKCSDNPVDNDKVVEIVGVYTSVPNPCTTVPCLPCGVFAIRTENRVYILTKNGHWFCGELLTWNGYTPSEGDTIVCKGKVTEKVDLNNKQYFEIEIESLAKRN